MKPGPLDPPVTDLEKKKTFWCRAIFGSAGLFLIPPMLGMIVTVFSMRTAFSSLGNSGIGDPVALSGHIGTVLNATLGGLFLSLVGLVLLIISIIRFVSCREKVRGLTA